MADNKSSGQDTRLPGASDPFPAPSDFAASKGGPISAKGHKGSKSALEETSPESSIGKPVCSPSSGSPASKATKRTHFTPQQIYKLEQFFLKSQFPTAKQREKLADELELSAKHIQVWFQNHRAKYKRKEKKKEARKSAVKLQPPSSWPAKLPFDSSIASLCSSSKDKSSKAWESRKETVSEKTDSISSDHSTASEEISRSTMYSCFSSENRVAYPLSPSSPLPTPHAPMRGQSSSLAPDSPLSSICSASLSPVQQSRSMNTIQSPASQTSSTTTTSQDPTQVYTSDINPFDISFQTNDFSPPIFAGSPVHLYDLLDDPEIASILREHLPPPKKISITESGFDHLPHGTSYHQSPFYQTSSSQVGYGPSSQPFHSPPPSSYILPPSISDSQNNSIRSNVSSSSGPTMQSMQYPLASDTQISHLLQSNPQPVITHYTQNHPYHPPPVTALPPMHPTQPFTNVPSPQYPFSLSPHHHPLAQVYQPYQPGPLMSTIDSQYHHHPSNRHHPQLLSLPLTTQVQPSIYHQQTVPSPLPPTPVTTVSVISTSSYSQPHDHKAPAR